MTPGRISLAIVLLLIVTTGVFAQRSSLVISGSVMEVAVTENRMLDPRTINEPRRAFMTQTTLDIKLKLTFHNRGDVPLIILNPDRFIGTKKILFLNLPSINSSVAEASDAWVWKYEGMPDHMPRFVKSLGDTYPIEYFKTLAPDQYYETLHVFKATSGYDIETEPDRDPKRPNIRIASPKFPYFKIQFLLNMKDTLPVAEAKTRWSKFGKLVTSSDGDFFFETDVIINKLPD